MKHLFLVSLGCPKNLIDSEVMSGLLSAAGYKNVEDPLTADILLVNTCGFVRDAVEEAIDHIIDLIDVKKQNKAARVVVAGCLVQRYGKELQLEFPEVDLFVGTEGISEIVQQISKLFGNESVRQMVMPDKPFLMNSTLPRQLSTPVHRAFLKVTEGCANRCSYCLIPSIRGKLRSRTIDDLVREARKLESSGVKELTLVAQDLTAYGADLHYKGDGLLLLLEALLQQTTIPWLRLLYLYPIRVSKRLLELMRHNQRIAPYLDIPLQHVSSRILKSMNRPYGQEDAENLIGMIRNELPGSALRTTFMVGFPGEVEGDVDLLEEFMRTFRFDHVGVFAYSNEEGCAAEKLSHQLSEDVKVRRRERLLAIQKEISYANNKKYIGKTVEVLVEGVCSETELLLEGRTVFQAPEIDGCVLINEGTASSGDFVKVLVSDAHPYDLVGGIITCE